MALRAQVGQKDSVVPNGELVRQDRVDRRLSQEALVASSDRRFSLKTLRRCENSQAISKEKLGYIASSLGFKISRYLAKGIESVEVEYECPSCGKGRLLTISEFTKASDGTFTRHYVTRQCANCGAIFQE